MNEDINHIPSNTPDFQTELAEKLAELAPEAIADGKIDVEKLKELLNGDADESNERFGLFWPGKRRALRAAQRPTTATLKPDVENSKDWDTTKNIFIEGDNLEVLKVLQKHYHGKIKMIYIDPPYNTGKDFVYPDNFKEGLDTYLEWTKQVNEEGQKLSTNSETEGRYHSNWLNMMYPRLKLARNLLKDDGVVFISIDDTEVGRLRAVMDEIFGENNFVADIAWQKKFSRSNDATYFSTMHDHILCYCRKSILSNPSGWQIGLLPRGDEIPVGYANPDDDVRGVWTSVALQAKSGSESTRYEIVSPSGRVSIPPAGRFWSVSKSTYERLLEDNRIWFGKNGDGTPRKKTFLSEVQNGLRPNTIFPHGEAGNNQEAKKELNRLFEGVSLFDGPKPTKLIKYLAQIANVGKDSLILDFFAGSGTTADAVMNFNMENDVDCRYLLVQLPEPTPDKSDAYKAGYGTISEISRERIRRAGEKIQEDFSEQLSQRKSPLDVGFRAYKLSDTNFSKWQVSSDTPANELEQHLLELRESANDNATPDDLFVELLLKQGYSLTEDIGEVSIAGLDLKTILDADGDVAVLAYLDEHTKPTLDQLREIADSKPVRFVILEDCFQGDDELKTNLVQICKTNGIELWTA